MAKRIDPINLAFIQGKPIDTAVKRAAALAKKRASTTSKPAADKKPNLKCKTQ